MRLGYVGDGPLAAAAARRLAQLHEVVRAGAWNCDVVFTCGASQEELLSSTAKIVIDQTPRDPHQTRAIADELRRRGAVLLDAPIHCERIDAMPEATAITCGGPAEVVATVRPLLECICPKVVYCGDTGSGQAARLVIGTVAACNRLVTYECAAVGLKNGLARENMAEVLNRSSGYNSALSVLESSGRTTDITLGDMIEELRMASRFAMHCGAPLLLANVGRGVFEAAAARRGTAASLDELA